MVEENLTADEFIDRQIEVGIKLKRLPVVFELSKTARRNLSHVILTNKGELDGWTELDITRTVNFLSGFYYGVMAMLDKEVIATRLNWRRVDFNN